MRAPEVLSPQSRDPRVQPPFPGLTRMAGSHPPPVMMCARERLLHIKHVRKLSALRPTSKQRQRAWPRLLFLCAPLVLPPTPIPPRRSLRSGLQWEL